MNSEDVKKILDDIQEKSPTCNVDAFIPPNHMEVGLNKAIYSIINRIDALATYNRELQEENKRLKDEHYEKSELKTMKENLEEMKKSCYRGFPLSEDEEEAIETWKAEHIKECHPETKKNPFAFGAIGGNFSYEFTPTSIGNIGKIKCCCGKEFTFRDLT